MLEEQEALCPFPPEVERRIDPFVVDLAAPRQP